MSYSTQKLTFHLGEGIYMRIVDRAYDTLLGNAIVFTGN